MERREKTMIHWPSFWRGFWDGIPHFDDPFYRWLGWKMLIHDDGWIIADKRMIIRLEWHSRKRN